MTCSNRLTARPNPEELAAAPHVLFGHVDPGTRYSTGAWLEDAEKVIQALDAQNQMPIFVGGTGLYFDALIKGFAPVPSVPDVYVREAEALVEGKDAAGRAELLAQFDPETARALKVADPQRVVRALAVHLATGKPLGWYKTQNLPGLLQGYALERIVLMPDRAVLRKRIAERFEAMMESGAVAEVEALLARDLDPVLPAMKAIGVSEIAAYLRGDVDRTEAVEKAVTATRQYAKRQSTWFRNRMGDWRFIDPLA